MSREKESSRVRKSSGDVLKKIVDAANSFKKAPLAGVNHPYFEYRDKKILPGVTSWDQPKI